jgi:DHA2 family multidrug resistance protein
MRLDYKWRAALVVALGLFMAILDTTIVSVALPQMQAYFHTDRDTITWVATAYFLAQSAIIPVTGYVSDRLGSKTVFLSALALFTLGSGLCAIAPSEGWLIGLRVLQGVGGGALFPMAFAIVFRVFPPAERGPAGAVIGVPVLLAPAFGPTIGGYLTTTFDWHAIFTINLPVGILALFLVAIVLRGGAAERSADGQLTGEEPRDTGRFDVPGLALAMVGVTSLVYGISEAGVTSWTDRKVDIALIAGGVLLLAFVVLELRTSDPVMDLRLFTNYTFTIANVLTWAISAFLFGSLFLLPVFFQTVQGATPLQSGEYVIVQGLGAAAATVVAGRLYNRVGPRWLTMLGFALVTAGTYGFTRLTPTASWQSLQGWLALRGLGLGLTNIPLQTLALSVVSNRAMARASSLSTVTRQLFGAVGLSALTTIFVTQSKTYGTAMAPQVRAAVRQQVQAATQTGAQAAVQQQVQAATQVAVQAYTSGSASNPATPLGQLTAQCAAPFGRTAGQHAAAIQACVQGHVQQYAQQYAAQYGAQHGAQIVQQYVQQWVAQHMALVNQFAAHYVAQHVSPVVATHALNDTFWVSVVGCAAAIVLALFTGRDPAVEAAKRARARGETVVNRPAVVGE